MGADSEALSGGELNIKKAQLKEWRVKFAAHLRELDVAANATPRKFRGQEVRSVPHSAYWRDRREGRSDVRPDVSKYRALVR